MAVKRQRAEFIPAGREGGIRKRECEAIREAYPRQPDSTGDADDWANAEPWA